MNPLFDTADCKTESQKLLKVDKSTHVNSTDNYADELT